MNSIVNTTAGTGKEEEEGNESSVPEKKAGGAEGIRTPDFLLAKEALSRTELQPQGFSFQHTAICQ